MRKDVGISSDHTKYLATDNSLGCELELSRRDLASIRSFFGEADQTDMATEYRIPRYCRQMAVVFMIGVGLWVVYTGLPSAENSKPKHEKQKCIDGCHQKPGVRFYSQCGEDRGLLSKIFSEPLVCNGTFVEIGALDGVRYSNSKFFEDALGWRGVLIEAFPPNVEKLRKNRPRAIIRGVAICPEGQKTVSFAGGAAVGGIKDYMTDHHKAHYIRNNKTIEVPCKPMGVLLREAGVNKIDLFSLDVEGAELMVLNTFDWSIPVRVFVIEMGHGGSRDTQVRSILKIHGYLRADWDIRQFCSPGGDCAPNEVFVNKDLGRFVCQ